MSETLGVKVEYKDLDVLAHAVAHMGGTVLGQGEHRLYGSRETGWGFTLPNWRFPLVLRADGVLRYDDYHGHWGSVTAIDTLNSEYALSVAEKTASENGYMFERVSSAVKVYFPGSREVWIFDDGRVEAVNFNGVGCHEATELFASALGQTTSVSRKPEFNQVQMDQGVIDG